MKVRFTVNIVIPALILLSGLFAIAMQYIVSERYDRNSINEEAQNHIRMVGSQILESANKQLGLNSLDKLNNKLRSMRRTLADLELAVVVDESGIILAATDSRQLDQPFSKFPALSALASQMDAQGRSDVVSGEIGEDNLIRAMFPSDFLIHSEQGEHAEIGLIAIVLNKQRELQIMHDKRLAVATYSGLAIALMTVLLWFFMSHFLVLPLQRLISTVRSFARGDFSVSANLAQANEMGEISSLLDSLATINMEREKAEATRNRLAQIVEESVNEIYVCDVHDYKVLNANRAARQNLGYTLEDCQTLMPWDFVDGMARQDIDELFKPLLSGEIAFHDFEAVHRRKDGSTYPVSVMLQFMATQKPPVYTAIIQDITDKKCQEQNVKLRDRAMEELDVGVSIFDATMPGCPMVYVNRCLCELSGYTAQELLGQGPELLREKKLNEEEIRKINAGLDKGESVQTILKFKRKNGSHYMGDVSLSLVRSTEGQLTHYVGIIRDITARLETNARLNRSQRIEAIGQLAGGVAHDFNNLLSVIIGNIEFLKLDVSNDKHRELLNQADVAAQMGARLTRKLLSFAKQDRLEPVVLDANEQVREALDLLRTTIGENYHLKAILAPELWHISADPSGIENAVINLTLNARDAMAEGGQILIRTSNISLTDAQVNDSLGVVSGDYVQLSVSDTGHGMTPEVRERIFEPFFTTKNIGENTGLGMASTYGFAQQSGGNVLVDSNAGDGAVISLLLPRYQEEVTVQQPVDGGTISLSGRNSRVLVVEDDAMVREVTVERLHVLGYMTTQAANGPEAIHLLKQAESFDLILTDLVMDGGMSGYDVANWVHENRPECKVLLTSGYSEQRVEGGNHAMASLRLLQKPYKMAELQEAVSSVLLDA